MQVQMLLSPNPTNFPSPSPNPVSINPFSPLLAYEAVNHKKTSYISISSSFNYLKPMNTFPLSSSLPHSNTEAVDLGFDSSDLDRYADVGNKMADAAGQVIRKYFWKSFDILHKEDLIMDSEVDHYLVLGLPSGEEGAKLIDKDIAKGYRQKALEEHPDKRRDDPNAHENFQKIKTSYEVLKDEKTRKLFDDLLKIKREKLLCQLQQDSKRRKMMSDLEERERAAFSPNFSSRHRNEEEIITRKLREEIARIRAMHANKRASPAGSMGKDTTQGTKENTIGSQDGLDKQKMLKVTWEKIGEGYTAQQLRDLFEKFGVVEDVLIQRSKKKKGSALVVMASKEAVAAVTSEVLGDLSNPLFIMPLQAAQPSASPAASNTQKVAENDGQILSNLVGSGYQAFEESVLEKMKKKVLLQDQAIT